MLGSQFDRQIVYRALLFHITREVNTHTIERQPHHSYVALSSLILSLSPNKRFLHAVEHQNQQHRLGFVDATLPCILSTAVRFFTCHRAARAFGRVVVGSSLSSRLVKTLTLRCGVVPRPPFREGFSKLKLAFLLKGV